MSSARPAVLAYVSAPGSAFAREMAAAFEEEGVPLITEPATGTAYELAERAAALSSLGHGIGVDSDALVLALAVRPRLPYLELPTRDARAFGHAVARLVAGRPIQLSDPSPGIRG